MARFEELLHRHLDALYRMAIRLCQGREARAEDLLQEAAVRAYRRRDQLEDPEAARSWLYRILRRTHLNRERAYDRRPRGHTEDLDRRAFERTLAEWREGTDPEEQWARRRTRDGLAEALDELSEPLRTTVWLVDVEGLRQREAAEVLEVAEGTVASRLYRARRQLRDLLEDEFDANTGTDPR